MKNLKKLNSKGFAHWLVPLLAVVVIGAIGSYVYLRSSHAATLTKASCEKSGGVWFSNGNIPASTHGPCWSSPGAYLINYGTGKVGDGIDYVPASGNNPETGNKKSQKFNNPNYIIVVKGNWQACWNSACSNRSDPFTKSRSAPYYGAGGADLHLKGGVYPLCSYDLFLTNANNRIYQKLCTDTGVYIQRV